MLSVACNMFGVLFVLIIVLGFFVMGRMPPGLHEIRRTIISYNDVDSMARAIRHLIKQRML